MLGTAKTNALCAEGKCLRGIVRGIGVGTHIENAELVCPVHQAVKVAGNCGSSRLDLFAVDVAGGAVDGDPVAFFEGLAGELKLLVCLVHLDCAAAGDAAGAHAAGNDSRVGGHAAANGQNALCVVHALDVLGAGLQTDQDDLMTSLCPVGRGLCREDDLAACRAGGGGKTGADNLCLLEGSCVERRVQQRVEALRVDHGDGFFFGDHALVDQIAGDLHCGGSGAPAVTGLEHVELLVFDGELHVLHVAVVILELCADVGKLLVSLGHDLRQLVDGLRGADACDDVFALCVHQELAEQLLLAGRRVTGEGNARAGGVAGVAEDHGLDVDSGAPVGGDVVHAAVVDCAGVVPGAEDRLDGAHQLDLRVLRELFAELFLIFCLELLGKLLEVVCGQLGVERDASGFLHLVDELLEVFLADFHNDVGEHLDEAAVGVVNKALELRIGVACDHCSNDIVVKTQIQDGIHHTGHGSACAGADGNEQGVGEIAKLLAVDLLHDLDVLHDLSHDLVVDLAAILIVLGAGFGGDGEALRHRQAYVGHLCKVCTLAAKQLAHVGIAFGKQIHILFAHCFLPFYNK